MNCQKTSDQDASRATRLAEAPQGWKELLDAVPLPPKAITYEKGWELLDRLQALAVAAPDAAPAASSPEAAQPDPLGNLLARIHRDGGHYETEHGREKACADADAKVVQWLARDDAATAGERVSFEAWARDRGYDTAWHAVTGRYVSAPAGLAWEGWQAHAALASAPAGAGEGALAIKQRPPARPVDYRDAWSGYSRAELQYHAAEAHELRRAVRDMATMLANREWAEHVSGDSDIVALEVEITKLVDRINGTQARAALAGEPAVAAARPPKMPDEAIREWGERHDLRISGITDLRCAFDDAQTLHMAAPQDEQQEKQG